MHEGFIVVLFAVPTETKSDVFSLQIYFEEHDHKPKRHVNRPHSCTETKSDIFSLQIYFEEHDHEPKRHVNRPHDMVKVLEQILHLITAKRPIKY